MHPMFSVTVLSLVSVLVVSVLSLVGIGLLFIGERLLQRGLLYFVGFSTGAILGDVFLHMLPELAEGAPDFATLMPVILVGILFSFVVEKIIHWHHCHLLPEDHDHHDAHHHPVGYLCLIGDGIHNFVDGVLIAGSYLVSTEIGIATTVAVMLHEIPQEIGDFAVLMHSGFSRRSAILWNLLSAVTAVLGAVFVLIGSTAIASMNVYLLPFAAGNLLYIAGSDLIPELHKHTGLRQGIGQLLVMMCGMGFMYAMLFLE